jgi:hypothetical protein
VISEKACWPTLDSFVESAAIEIELNPANELAKTKIPAHTRATSLFIS